MKAKAEAEEEAELEERDLVRVRVRGPPHAKRTCPVTVQGGNVDSTKALSV